MKQSQRIVKNILAGSVAVVLGGLLQLASVVLVARTVSVSDFGIYSFILAFAVFIQLLADSGLTNILVRELATKPKQMPEILGVAIALVWVLSFGAELIILAVVPFLHFSLEIKILTLVMGAATLSLFHSAAYGAALRSQEENELTALGYLVHKALIFALLFFGLKQGLGLVAVVMAELIPNILLCCFYGWLVTRRYGRPKLRIDFALWKYLLIDSIPVGGSTMVRLLAQQVDIIILSWLTDAHTVGLFSGPYRISMALRFIPQTMAIPLYPMYARLAASPESKSDLQAAYERSVRFFVLAGFPVATIFVIFSGKMITLLLGDKYQPALLAMQLLGIAFLPFFVSSPFPFLLTALNKQKYLWSTSLMSLILRIAMNFALIPFCGYLGPCIAFFLSEALILVVRANWLTEIGFPLAMGKAIWRPTVASCCMGVALYFFKESPVIWLAPLVLLGLLAYLLVLVVLGTFTAADLRLAKEGLGFMGPLLAKWTKQAPVR